MKGASEGRFDVAVVGSINQDLGMRLDRSPSVGETVLGDDVRWSPGGKGANQAVGCAHLGLRTSMVGAVGDDVSGRRLRERMANEGVDIRHVSVLDAATGLAVVLVDRDGDSTIVVSPGANGRLAPSHVDEAERVIASARALLCQLEVPVATVARAAELASGLVVLNPAPGHVLPSTLLQMVDILVPNRHELASITGRGVPRTAADVTAAVRELDGPRAVVVTLGADGALVVEKGKPTHVPAVTVTPVDATGAGDSFCAGLVAGLLEGAALVDAVRDAVRVAAATTLRLGAMDALPRREEVGELLAASESGGHG